MKRLLKLTIALAAAGVTLAASAAGPAIDAIATSVDKVSQPHVSSPFVPNAIAPYCANTYTSGVEPITLVQINDINNPSPAATGGTPHEDFTAIIGTLRPGSTYAVTMKSNTDGAFLHGHALYADWNQDGLLTGANEGYFVGTFTGSTGTDGFSATALITVPASAVSGNTRLRAMTVYNATTLAAIPPCRTGTGFGQSEDYTVNIDPGAPLPPALPNLSKTFTPNNRDFATPTTTLTLNLGQFNPGAASLNLTANLVDTLPVGMTVAATPNESTTCPSGIVTAAPGAGTVTLATGAQIPPAGCTVTADVQVAAVGVYANSIAAGALQTNAGNGPAAAANFTATSATTPTYTVGFEPPTFAVANLGTQGGWGVGGTGSLAADWKVSTTNPGAGAQHLRTTWTTAGTAGTTTVAISPTQGQGTTAYSIASARLAIQPNATGTTFDFAPQDTGAGSVITRVRFNNDAAKSIQVLDPITVAYVNTGTSWVAGATYFDLKVITKRSDSTYVLCLNGTQFYAGTGFAGNLRNIAIIGTKGTGTNGNILDADNVTIDNSNIGTCNGLPPPHTVTPVVGTPSGSISPNTPVVVADGATTAFTVTPDAGFHIDTVTGCGGSLAANTYTTGPITADCTVTANFAADIVTHTVTAVVGTPSGTITPPSATVNDGATTAFTVTADPGFHIDTVTGCGGSLAGATYTTGPITADCTVTANFAANTTPTPAFFNSALTTSSPTFDAPNASSSGSAVQYYCAQQFTVDTSGAYVIETASPNTTGTPSNALDTYLVLYANTFNPATPNTQLSTTDDFTGTLTVLPGPYAGTVATTTTGFQGAQPGSRLTPTLTAGTNYFIVNSSFRQTDYVATGNQGNPVGPFYTGIGGAGTVTLVGTSCVTVPPVTHTVTSSVGTPSGTITPPSATVNDGATTQFTLTADAGFHIDTVGGTCPAGSLAGGTYTTGAIIADCTVVANFAADVVTHTVTAVVGTPSGTITPPSATVNDGATTAFTVTADAGFHIDTVTGCGGSLAANTYTTGPITADCTVTANFAADGGGGDLLTVDLSVANQITVSATSGVSAATISGATTTGFYFQNFLASAGTLALGTTNVVGTATLTAASVAPDGSPALFRGASGADAGLNIWSYSAAATTTFTTGQVAFAGTATWSLAPAVYTAMLTAPNSGNLYFPADDSTDIAGATLLGTYSVIHPGAGNPPAATVSPTTLSFTVAANATATQTLNIANAAGSDALTYAITGQASRPARLIPRTSQSRKTGESLLRSSGARLLRSGTAVHTPPAPWSPVGPDGSFAFQADDGSYENGIAWTDGTTQNTALWLNRYAATGAMTIDTVSIEWPGATAAAGDVTGKAVNLVAYFDADSDGDPTNATRLGSNTPITINGPDAFETYPTNFVVPAAGDVYLGFVDTFAAGGTTPALFSAALDGEGDPNVGWVAAMSTGDADVDVIGNNDNIGTLSGLSGGSLAGVWMVRGTGTATVTSCAGAAVNWLSANPASGSVSGGANTNVTVTADPSADSLAPGSYTGMLCIATNDPTQAVIGVPVSLTVTEAPFVACSAADEIFCDGFDPAASATVITGTINQPAVADGDGSSFDFALEDFHGYDAGITTDDINLYTLGAPAISVYWYGDLTPPEAQGLTGGVVGTAGGTDFVVLHSGDVIGPSSPVSAASQGADMSAFEAGVTAYIGVAFYNEVTSAVNYGYLHVQTSAGGFPIQVLDYGYDNSGAAITIP